MTHHLQPICRAITHVEENLTEPIDVASMADAACFSLYHFCRVFNRVTRHTPYQYLMRRRLSESAKNLLTTPQKIIEIAYEYQFNSPETFSRAFRRMFSMLPKKWRQCGRLGNRLLLPPFTLEYLDHINHRLRFQSCCARKGLELVGLTTLAQNTPTCGASLWQAFEREIHRTEMTGKLWGLTYYSEDEQERAVWEMAAVESDSADSADTPFVTKMLPPCRYAKFLHLGTLKTLPFTFAYIYHTWLPQTGRTRAGNFELRSCASFAAFYDDEPAGEREIFIPIR